MTITYKDKSHTLPLELLSRIDNTIIVNIFDKQLTKEDKDLVFDIFINDTENGFPQGIDKIEIDDSYATIEGFTENMVNVISCKDITPKNIDGNHHQYSNSFILEFKIKG